MAAAALASCKADPVTELVLAVDTDMTVDELEHIDIVIQDLDRPEKVKVVPIDVDHAHIPPFYVGLVAKDGRLSHLRVSAISTKTYKGEQKPREFVSRSHTVRFSRGEILEVPLHLMRHCEPDDYCEDDAFPVCSEGPCLPVELPRKRLKVWRGPPDIPTTEIDDSTAGELDGGSAEASTPGDGDGDVDPPGDGDGDGGVKPVIDAGGQNNGRDDAGPNPPMCGEPSVDLSTNPAHCGECNHVCGVEAQTIAACSMGKCECAEGYQDCKDQPGCETSRNDPKFCGDCDTKCNPAHQLCIDMKCVDKP